MTALRTFVSIFVILLFALPSLAQHDIDTLPECTITEEDLTASQGAVFGYFNSLVLDVFNSVQEFGDASGLNEFRSWIDSALAIGVEIDVALYNASDIEMPPCQEMQRLSQLVNDLGNGIMRLAAYTSANFTWAIEGEDTPRRFEEARDEIQTQMLEALTEYIEIVEGLSADD